MHNRLCWRLAAALAVLAASPATAAQRSPSGQDLTPDGQGAYAELAGAADLFAIRSAELALEKARDSGVRAFADAMARDHRTSMGALQGAMTASGLGAVEPAMLPMHWEMLRRLERSRGTRFDRIYLDQLVETHEQAQALHDNFRQRGNSPPLQAHAEAMVPTAARHLQRARSLQE
jgi:putative membrane protein